MATQATAMHAKEQSSQPMSLLYFLDIGAGQVRSVHTDGSNVKVLVDEGPKHPDGLAVDAQAGYIYWTNMGSSAKTDDGTIVRSDLDG
ncbi:MAG TPA: 3-hydroxyacyl-CoA dehydrogenase, partial [Acidisarcina sp.]